MKTLNKRNDEKRMTETMWSTRKDKLRNYYYFNTSTKNSTNNTNTLNNTKTNNTRKDLLRKTTKEKFTDSDLLLSSTNKEKEKPTRINRNTDHIRELLKSESLMNSPYLEKSKVTSRSKLHYNNKDAFSRDDFLSGFSQTASFSMSAIKERERIEKKRVYENNNQTFNLFREDSKFRASTTREFSLGKRQFNTMINTNKKPIILKTENNEEERSNTNKNHQYNRSISSIGWNSNNRYNFVKKDPRIEKPGFYRRRNSFHARTNFNINGIYNDSIQLKTEKK